MDDIQDFWLSSVQRRLISFFSEKATPLTIGIIGSLVGQDQALLDTIDRALDNSSSGLELANHSFDNTVLANLDEEAQFEALSKSGKFINALFGATPTILVPPRNEFDDATVRAALSAGISVISASFEYGDATSAEQPNTNILKLHETASTGTYNPATQRFVGKSARTLIRDIRLAIAMHGYAVVTIHPQEFSQHVDSKPVDKPDSKQFEVLKTLLDRLEELETPIRSMTEVAKSIGQ